MFTIIDPTSVEAHAGLMKAVFRLRKRVFADKLGWDVPVTGDEEFDEYDAMGANYLVWTSPDRSTFYGALRLMPTDGPTLLHDVFWATHGGSPALCAPDIWEGTRMCLDETAIARDMPGCSPARAMNLLLVALCEAALSLGIRRMVCNFEPAMARVYRRAGVRMTMHGSADGYGRRPVCCASFEVSVDALDQMRRTVGIETPLVRLDRSAPLQAPRPLPAMMAC